VFILLPEIDVIDVCVLIDRRKGSQSFGYLNLA